MSAPVDLTDPVAPVVQLTDLSRFFPGPPVVEVLNDIDLTIEAGEYVSMVGPSGSGKSTLLHILGLLDTPTTGTYRLDGLDTAELSDNDRAALRCERIGFVFQGFHLLAHRTTTENVELAELYSPTAPRRGRRERAVEALERVGLGHRLDSYPTTLSGGERQRVAIARAVMATPSLLLADEPTGNLDTETSDSILALFGDLHDQGLTVAVVTHDRSVAARAHRQITIVDGRVRSDA